MNLLLLAYYLAFFAIAFVWPTWRLWKRDRINGLVLPNDDSAHGLIGHWFKALVFAILLFVVAIAAGMDLQDVGAINWAQNASLRLVGYGILAGSAAIIAAAQMYMGKSWRIGIDQASVTELVTHGLFSRSRNPIFLGMRLNMFGLFLVLPCAVTFAIMLVSEALISVQVRLEEAHLIATIGDAYRNYQKRTPRWL